MRCDPERGFAALSDVLANEHGVSIDPVGKNEHERVVERNIRTIKERVRRIVNTLPYRLTEV